MNMENSLIFKPNELIEVVSRPVSIVGLKAYNSILKRLQKENTDRMVISPSEILTEIGATNSYEELYSYLDELQKTQVKSIDKRGKLWGSFVLISEFKKLKEGIFVQVPATIYNVLCSGNSKKQENLYYTTIKLLEEKTFNCSYSIIFYEIFKKYEKIELPVYSLDELKDLTKTTGKYKVYYEFKRCVLNPALNEINKYDTNYIYSFKEIKISKKVYSIQFIKENKLKNIINTKFIDKSSLSDELLKAIEKARKNRFINDKFSQRAVEKAITQYNEALVIKALYKLYNFENKVSSFTKLLNSTIQEVINLNEVEQEMKRRKQKELEEQKEDDLSELDRFKSLILSQAKGQISIEEWSKLSIALIKLKTEEEVKNFISNHELLINYKLF